MKRNLHGSHPCDVTRANVESTFQCLSTNFAELRKLLNQSIQLSIYFRAEIKVDSYESF